MTNASYLLTESALIIDDEELDLHVQLSFDLPRLAAVLSDQEGLIMEKEDSGWMRTAYLTFQEKKHGACREFYPNGQIKAEMYYDQGLLHGPSIFFGHHSEILAKTWYIQGKKVGKVHYFYPSGQLSSLQRYKQGVCDGLQEYWYEEGAIKSVIPYQRGVLHGEVYLFWESGKPKRICTYFQGEREGWDRLWNQEDILIHAAEFHRGVPIGKHQHFFSDGKIREEFLYHTPTRFDRKEWNNEGKLIYEGVYASDLTYTEKNFLNPHEKQERKGYWNGQRLCWK